MKDWGLCEAEYAQYALQACSKAKFEIQMPHQIKLKEQNK